MKAVPCARTGHTARSWAGKCSLQRPGETVMHQQGEPGELLHWVQFETSAAGQTACARASAEVRQALTQDPAYRPAHPPTT
jgi:hypothetical protein